MAKSGLTTEAVATYTQSIRRNSINPDAYYNIGMAWLNQGEYKKANTAFKRAQQQYRQQGNIQLAEQIEALIIQTAQGNRPTTPAASQPEVRTQTETPTQNTETPTQTETPTENNNTQNTETQPNNSSESTQTRVIEFGEPMPVESEQNRS
jgi:tetratricopeptide (TPR) repeat protein